MRIAHDIEGTLASIDGPDAPPRVGRGTSRDVDSGSAVIRAADLDRLPHARLAGLTPLPTTLCLARVSFRDLYFRDFRINLNHQQTKYNQTGAFTRALAMWVV